MSDIIVAGAGIGGLTAAMKLAAAGHSVTVYEKNKRADCGYEQSDSFDASAMDYAGIPIPDGYIAPGNEITFYSIDETVEPITTPVPANYKNITVERKVLFAYLASLAEEAGVRFCWETEIKTPLVLGGRVCGIETEQGKIYGDLIIDACGMNSPLRRNLPDFMQIDKEPGAMNYLHAYRGIFNRVESAETGERYKIYVNDDSGFTWIITEDNCVDVLIVNFSEISYPQVADRLHKVSALNPQMGKELLRNGRFMQIPVRQPLAVMVADGYAAIGDSAFMTYAAKGSGIAYSLKAGTILARAVLADADGIYNADTLWKYEEDFFKEVGFDACRIAMVKNLMPAFSADEVNEIFKRRLVSSEELYQLISGQYQKSKLPGMIKDKIKILNELPEFKAQLISLAGWMGRFAVMEPFFPNKYSRKEAAQWRERYNKFFEEQIKEA
ncbi:MAG: NAD(P)/FAD-dependent oxidoreductase [Clostridia bacterium]|nr:NAD(P)/FAD-dependent oxidoreductase [Clostridia bacterium]